MAAGKQYIAKRRDRTTELIAGIAIWSTDTGKQTRCLSFSCDPTDEPVRDTANPVWESGSILDPAGRWTLDYSEDGISVLDLTGPTGAQVIQVNSPDADYWWHIGRIALDEVHQRYAIIYQEGRIVLSPLIHPSLGNFEFGDRIVTTGRQNDLQPILDASFDPTGRWLAIVRNNELSMWQMAKEKQYTLTQDAQGLVALNFDQTGKLLFVATPDKLTIWDVAKQVVIATIETPGISTLTISQDNRLLVWGDSQGVVHVWGTMI